MNRRFGSYFQNCGIALMLLGCEESENASDSGFASASATATTTTTSTTTSSTTDDNASPTGGVLSTTGEAPGTTGTPPTTGEEPEETTTSGPASSTSGATSSAETGSTVATTGGELVSLATEILPIFTDRCSCHLDTNGAGKLKLTPEDAYNSLVGKPSEQLPDMLLVNPGDPSTSYLWHKLMDTQDSVGGEGKRMPPSKSLSADDLALVETWIVQGAAP